MSKGELNLTQKHSINSHYSTTPQEYTKQHNSERNVSKGIINKTTSLGLNATKAVSKLTVNTSRKVAKKITKKIGSFALKRLWEFVLTNSVIVVPVIVVLFIVMMGIGSVATSMFVVYAKERIDKAQETATDVVNTYAEYLSESNEREVIDYTDGEEESTNNGSLTDNGGSIFDGTKDSAEMLDGKSLLAQAYNAMLTSQRKYSTTGYNMELMYGIAVTETCCSPIKWSYYMPVGTDYNSSGNYDISKYGVNEFMKARDEGKIDAVSFHNAYNDGSVYVTPFQMSIALFKRGTSTPSSWSSSTWKNTVSGMTSTLDATGDGIADPFNMQDVFNVLGNYITTSRMNMISKVQFKSDSDKDDMMLMALASRHVGTTNKTKSRADGCAFSKYETNTEWRGAPYWCYPYIEGLNPHIDLMRSAVNEYKSNGPIFQEYKEFMYAQDKTNSNGPKSLDIIEKLYKREGWTQSSNGSWSKAFGDGDGKVTISGQDIGYIFRAYWGAKIGFPEFEKLAKNT